MNDTGHQKQIRGNDLLMDNSESTALKELSVKMEHLDVKSSNRIPHQVSINTVSQIEVSTLDQEKIKSVSKTRETEKVWEISEKLSEETSATEGNSISPVESASRIKEAGFVSELGSESSEGSASSEEIGSALKQEAQSTSSLKQVKSVSEIKQAESASNRRKKESTFSFDLDAFSNVNEEPEHTDPYDYKTPYCPSDKYCPRVPRESPLYGGPSYESNSRKMSMSSIAAQVIRQNLLYWDKKAGKWTRNNPNIISVQNLTKETKR